MFRAFVLAVLVAAFASCLGAAVSPQSGAGALLGAAVGGVATLGAMWRVQRVLATRPERGMQVLVEGFLFKLALLGASVAVFRLVPTIAERFEWRAYLLAFGTTAVAVLFAAVYELHRSRVGGVARTGARSAASGSGAVNAAAASSPETGGRAA